MMQLTKSGPTVSGSADDVRRLRAEFERRHCIRLPSLLPPDGFDYVRRHIERGAFAEKIHGQIGVELCMAENAALSLLYFLTNDRRVFSLVRDLTGCSAIGGFVGRIYRMVPRTGHYDSWHTDSVAHRMIGLSVNLSTERYAGGVFQLRERGSETVLMEAPNTGAGDAILFRIADNIEHRVTPVEGTAPKTAFAGWFVSEPDFLKLLLSRSATALSSATAE
jgi:2OG-Fe(II) oxygenase superfamily